MKILIAATAALTLAISTTHAAPILWSSAVGGNDHFYEMTSSRMNWDSAEAFAVSQGGHLMSITSAAEQAFILATFLSGPNDRLPLWLGINDVAVEGTFVWTTGEPVTFTAWNNNEPNNTGDEHYGVINWHHAVNPGETKGSWNDTRLNGDPYVGPTFDPIAIPYFAVVETVPEPASAVLLLVGAAFCLRRRSLRTHERST